MPQRRWSWLANILRESGHEVFVLAPPPHYLRNISLSEWWRSEGFRPKQESGRGTSGEWIVRTPFIPGGQSLTRKVVNQATVALGSIGVLLRRGGPLDELAPDLVIGTVPALPTAVVAYVASLKFKTPFVIDLRDAWPALLDSSKRWNESTGKRSLREKVLSKGPLQLVSVLTGLCLNAVLKRASRIIVTSDALRSEIDRNFHEAGKAQTVRNVFPAAALINKVPRLDGPTDSLNVLYAGTMGRAQDLGNVVEAAYLASIAGVTVCLRFVGAGAAKNYLKALAQRRGISAVFEDHRDAFGLEDLYVWADTALVHLADWAPLELAVPSKTYELMNQKLHITGVVAGETAELIGKLRLGDVVAPSDPGALAQLWCDLARERSRLNVGDSGVKWVEKERNIVAPNTFLSLLNSLSEMK